jgi:ribosome biogenesis GTPase A
MASARKQAAKTMAYVDVVVEVLDARIPVASCNPMIDELRRHRQRPSLKLLNKTDLADPAATAAWLAFIAPSLVWQRWRCRAPRPAMWPG